MTVETVILRIENSPSFTYSFDKDALIDTLFRMFGTELRFNLKAIDFPEDVNKKKEQRKPVPTFVELLDSNKTTLSLKNPFYQMEIYGSKVEIFPLRDGKHTVGRLSCYASLNIQYTDFSRRNLKQYLVKGGRLFIVPRGV